MSINITEEVIERSLEALFKLQLRIWFYYDWAMYEEYPDLTDCGDGILRVTKFNNQTDKL